MNPIPDADPARRWPAVIAVGSMTGIVIVAVMFSFAGLVYSGDLAGSLPTGAGPFLIGAAVMNVGAARWTSIKGAVIIPQDATTAVVAVSLAALLPAIAGEAAGKR